jgi:hypothetical protein
LFVYTHIPTLADQLTTTTTTMMDMEEEESSAMSNTTTTTATPDQVINQRCSVHVDGASVGALVLRSVKGSNTTTARGGLEAEAVLLPLPSHRLIMKLVKDSGSGGYEVARAVEIGKRLNIC